MAQTETIIHYPILDYLYNKITLFNIQALGIPFGERTYLFLASFQKLNIKNMRELHQQAVSLKYVVTLRIK